MDFKTALPGYFTASEAAKYLGYTNSSFVSELCREGRISAYKVGVVWLIPEKQVEALKAQSENARTTRGSTWS
jgi:excisionase family DNA binding protein